MVLRALPLVLLLLSAPPARALDNGLARTPPMGFSTWSVFQKNINESLIRELADAMRSSGLAAAGYDYLLVDDGWEGSAPKGCTGCAPNRDEQGRLVVDPAKFPSGMNETAACASLRRALPPPVHQTPARQPARPPACPPARPPVCV